jgi:hypothetical protein
MKRPPRDVLYASAYDLDTVPPLFRRFVELSMPIRERVPNNGEEAGKILGVLGGFLYW